jgi:cystathionine gamma-lyase
MSGTDDAGGTWVKGEAGVLPKGVAAAARARLDAQRERLAAERAGDAPGPDAGPAGSSDDAPAAAAGAVPPPTGPSAEAARSPERAALESDGPGGAGVVRGDVIERERHRDDVGMATRVVTAGLPAPVQGEPFLQGPVFAGPYHAAGDPQDVRHVYGRMSNPGFERYEEALGALDGGGTVVFASGMAAATAVLQCLLGSGDTLVAPSDGYPGVLTFAREHLAPRGVGVRTVPTTDEAIRRAAKGAALVWIETPANPGLQVLALEETIAICREAGAKVVVDNTLATPLRQRPLELGADLVVSSDSKHLTGHSDLILGHVSSRDTELLERIRGWRTLAGAVPGPFEIWLAHRSLGTLDVRLERQEAVAAAVFAALRTRDDLDDVRYPGLSSVVGFDLGTMRRAKAFLGALRLVVEATSFGGMHSSAERRDRFGDGQVGPGYIRFSAGLETAEDVVADLMQALDAAG